MNKQLAYSNECPEDHMATDEPTDLEIERWREEELQQNIERWRSMPDKTMQDCMEWLLATHKLEYTYDEGIDVHLACIGVESKALSLRLLTGLKEACIRHNDNGQYDDDIAFCEERIDSSRLSISYGYYLTKLVELLEMHGHDETIYGLALELIDQKINGCVIKEMAEVLREIYWRLIGFD